MILHILKPEAEEYHKLTEICQTAKKHRGYPQNLLDILKDELTITVDHIHGHIMLKAQNERNEILGFGAINNNSGKEISEITHLYVLPDSSKHVANFLLENLEKMDMVHSTLKVITDPIMLTFYQKNGYQKVGEVKSKADGTYLPLLKKIIKRSSER